MKILIATDGSPYARLALERAAQLARGSQAQVRVLTVAHLVNLATYGGMSYSPEAVWEVPSREDCDGILAEAVAYFKEEGIMAEAARRIGEAADAILAEAEEWYPDVIVVGSHGRTGLKRFLLGSVSSQVVNHATCSVLIAKEPHPVAGAATPLHVAVAEKA